MVCFVYRCIGWFWMYCPLNTVQLSVLIVECNNDETFKPLDRIEARALISLLTIIRLTNETR